MLANQPLAIRIDESRMCVHALIADGERKVQLHANCKDEQYVKQVKELLSGEIMNSPGGYPVFIQRWTRMGQMNDESLAELLLLGEQEAVVAAVHAPGLSDELCRRAWWAMEDADNARQMLSLSCVVEGNMGPILARYLIEFLPFETEADKMMQSIRLVLQPGLVDDETRLSLWKKAKRKTAYYLGFLVALPDELPLEKHAGALVEQHQVALIEQAEAGNRLAELLLRVGSASGQTWLYYMQHIFNKAVNQDVINDALDAIANYFSLARPEGKVDLTIDELISESQQWLEQKGTLEIQAILDISADFQQQLVAARCLSGVGYGVVRPVFRDTTAIGSLMRRKIQPVVEPMLTQFASLSG